MKQIKIYKCPCVDCVTHPDGEKALSHTSINHLVAVLDEKHRRQLVGFLASQLGHGGIKVLSEITGLYRKTIRRGKMEIGENGIATDSRTRVVGGGRHKVEKKKRTC